MLAAALEAYVSIDPGGRVVAWNAAAADVVGILAAGTAAQAATTGRGGPVLLAITPPVFVNQGGAGDRPEDDVSFVLGPRPAGSR